MVLLFISLMNTVGLFFPNIILNVHASFIIRIDFSATFYTLSNFVCVYFFLVFFDVKPINRSYAQHIQIEILKYRNFHVRIFLAAVVVVFV